MKQLTSILLLLVLMLTLSSCTAPQNDGHYSAEFPYDPLQYMTFLKKEIQGIENQVSAAMEHAVIVARGDFPAAQAASSAKDSLSLIKDAYSSIDVMRPPEKYIDTRQNALDIIKAIEKSMGDFIAELEKLDPSGATLLKIKNMLNGQSISLTALVNAYWA